MSVGRPIPVFTAVDRSHEATVPKEVH
jgi:hypothetical protein